MVDAGYYVKVTLKTSNGSAVELEVDTVVGTDGIHSAVRQFLGVPFVGKVYPKDGSVAEIETSEWNMDAQARLYLKSDGITVFISTVSWRRSRHLKCQGCGFRIGK